MKSYILPELTEAQLGALRKAKVQLFNWKKGTFLIDNEEALQQALAVLNACATETGTDCEGIVQLQLYFSQPGQPIQDPKRAQSRANYIKACSARFDALIKVARETLKKKRAELPKTEAQFVTMSRQSCFQGDTRSQTELEAGFRQELALVRELPKVKRVRVTRDGRTVLVYTDTLFAGAGDSQERYEIGQFLISIQIIGHPDQIRFYNGTRRVRTLEAGMNAPYVFADGTMMELEIKEILLELLARLEFAALVDLAIQFIETVNDDEAGRLITAWPRATTD